MSDVKEEVATTEVATEKKKKVFTTSYLAVVKFFDGPGEAPSEPQIINAKSKVEMFEKLADPLVQKVYYVVKGRVLNFTEARRVKF